MVLMGLMMQWCTLCADQYEAVLFHTASLVAFWGALRIRKLVASLCQDNSGWTLCMSDASAHYPYAFQD